MVGMLYMTVKTWLYIYQAWCMFCKYNDFNINKTLLYEKLIFIIRYVNDVQLMNVKALKIVWMYVFKILEICWI